MKAFALVMAAGESARFGEDKLMLPLGGRPVWRWSADTLANHPAVTQVFVVCQPHRAHEFAPYATLDGGRTRQESVRNALNALPQDGNPLVLIHDGARPFLSASVIDRVLTGLREQDAAFPCIPVTDTIKEITDDGFVTVDRSRLRAAQTPQAASLELLLKAHASCHEVFTDDMSLLESMGIRTIAVEGDRGNFKITTTDDYELAVSKINTMETRTGFGYDIHAFSGNPNRKLVLGGVEFPGERGLEGHSDADVLLHAVVDALLGAAGLGDIGQIYPNDDPTWKDCSSLVFLREAGGKLQNAGWEIENIDSTVLAERPKIMGVSGEMRSQIATALRVGTERVSIKATTNESLGAIGRGEGIAAFATAHLRRRIGGTTHGSPCTQR